MKPERSRRSRISVKGVAACLLILLAMMIWPVSISVGESTLQQAAAPQSPTLWYTTSLSPGNYVPSSAAPALADLNGDGKLDIIAATFNGYVFAINGNGGAVLWSRKVLDYGFHTATCGTDTRINSSPVVGMLRAPNTATPVLAVAVSVGDVFGINGNGGVIAFDKDGNWLWTKLALDDGPGLPDGCADGVHSTPTIADVDGDGYNEVIFGGFDRHIHVLTDQGQEISPWPRSARDTVWSSAAVGDIDGDGQNEIVIGTDEGQEGRHCPYPLDWAVDYCGGLEI